MKYILFSICICTLAQFSFAQSISEIKADRQTYIWGEGEGMTIARADQQALASLISQISTQVEGNFTMLKEENQDNYIEKYQEVIKSYSNATLHNTERIIVSNEPDAKVFRYIKRSDVHKVFQQRKAKIKEFVAFAEKAEENRQIADALRYYYWALNLLKSHPDGNSITFTYNNGMESLLATSIPIKINDLFTNLSFSVEEKIDRETFQCFRIGVYYKNNPVVNLDYAYFDGRDFSNLISAKDGIGMIELTQLGAQSESIKLKVEYIFENEARIDRELETVMKQMNPMPFRKSYYDLKLTETNEPKKKERVEQKLKDYGISQLDKEERFRSTIRSVLGGIENNNFTSIQNQFTPEAYQTFQTLIQYGNAKIIRANDFKFLKFNDKVICRSITMSFSFKYNKQFVEDVVFYLNEEGKIENMAFALSQVALDDIMRKKVWNEKDRLVLVSFLEHYKTAYALKRLDYIESIFADDALIITGAVVQVKSMVENQYKNNKIIRYNRQSKAQYIKNLRYSFQSKEYINLKFEESEIRKAGKGGDIYGVQIKQNYYSSNYGDTGYLFLMVDLNNPDLPIIHVRTWQPEKNEDGSIYGLSDF